MELTVRELLFLCLSLRSMNEAFIRNPDLKKRTEEKLGLIIEDRELDKISTKILGYLSTLDPLPQNSGLKQ